MSIDRIRHLITKEAILLALAPAVALTAGYFFELGYAHYFGYPQELIKVDFQTTIIAFATCLFIIGGWYFYFDLAFSNAQKRQSKLAIGVRALVLSLTYWLPFYLAMNFTGKHILFFILVSIMAVAMTIVAIRRKSGESERDDLPAKLTIPALIFLCVWAATLIYGTGKYAASMKTFWLQTFEMDSKTYALVAVYDDMGIGVLVEEGRLKRHQTITFNLGSSGNLRFSSPPKFLK